MNNKIYVVIKDGNRTVGWDYHDDTTIRTVLANKYFTWEPNTVRVNGKEVPDEKLDTTLGEYADGCPKVRILMQRLKKKEEVEADG